ncbi:MAG TPA: twin-arginine translocase subunit TatC, partial [Bryobacteraceae bacterium]|nr:twin-arginine translocase subunit TatC [Bryobacteraceae bacterium]
MDDEKLGGSPPDGTVVPAPYAPPGENRGAYEDPHAFKPDATTTAVAVASPGGALTPPSPPSPPVSPQDAEEEGMLRMSFMEHLEELRTRIIRALMGLAVAFVLSLLFASPIWDIISEPAIDALKHLNVNPPHLVQTTPMEAFSIIWVKLPLLVSIFLASPWIVYQLWAFISPGLYRKEKRMAAPFVLLSGVLFIVGGLFAYFLAFRFGLTFLLSIGTMNNVTPMVTISEYFDLFVDVMLGVGLVFELPIVIFSLTLLRLLSPRFLLRHSRYAILFIVIAAAIITPTPDVFNLMLFAVPMCILYFVGVFAGLLVVMHREGRRFPWKPVLLAVGG